nr:MAG TPA: hypothetical protein [Caudoviricetes sp.]
MTSEVQIAFATCTICYRPYCHAPLIPVHFALAGSPHWAEQVLTHFLAFEVTVPLSSHRQPKVEGLFSTKRRKILLKAAAPSIY